jgi:nitroreductase
MCASRHKAAAHSGEASSITEIGLFEAMYTARIAAAEGPDPVPEELITRVLDAAIRAPSGGNAQNWIFIVVREEAQRRRLAAIYRKASDDVAEIYAARGQPDHLTDAQYRRLLDGGSYLWDHMGDAPVLLVPCNANGVAAPNTATASPSSAEGVDVSRRL